MANYYDPESQDTGQSGFLQFSTPNTLSTRSLNRLAAYNERSMTDALEAALDVQYFTECTKRAIVNHLDVTLTATQAAQIAPEASNRFTALANSHAKYCLDKLKDYGNGGRK